jgi:AcrR family transcriptional regulator
VHSAKNGNPRRVHYWTNARGVFSIADRVGRTRRVPNKHGKDRRVGKTRALLHGALASLIHEKGYDAIVVKEILARANVGRSTFYTHFRDKDELLESGIRDMLRVGETTSATRPAALADRVLRFSLPILEHIEQHRRACDPPVDAPAQAVVHGHLRRVVVELIADDLRRVGWCRRGSGRDVPDDLLAQHVASTFLLVLNWWAESEEPLPSREANDLFRSLVLPAISEALRARLEERGLTPPSATGAGRTR